jgi:hemolysin activation/secretion protein
VGVAVLRLGWTVATATLGLALSLSPVDASGQFQSFERPGERPLEVPPPAPPSQPEFVLPTVPEPPEAEAPRLSEAPKLVVKEFRVTGSSVFPADAFARLTDPYTNRPIQAEDLDELADQLTRLYIDAGYRNSGAVLPDQEVRDGIVEYRIVEGRLTDLEIEGNRWFRTGYLKSRILRGAHTPLSVPELEQELQMLQQDERVRRVNAELIPGERPGEARLRVGIEESVPFLASLEASNFESPSIGAYRGRVELGHLNFTGNGDVLRSMASFTESLREYSVGYEVPVSRWDTTLGATTNTGSLPDGQFFAWLAQLQWVRRFDPWGIEALLRSDVQLASSPLLSMEQYSIGGYYTVRGYREKQLVRDNGLVCSAEIRIPLWTSSGERFSVQLAPFFDYGRSWNTDRGEVGPRNLYSVGVGLRTAFTQHLSAEIYWGHRLNDVPQPEDHNLQDHGVSFAVVLEL